MTGRSSIPISSWHQVKLDRGPDTTSCREDWPETSPEHEGYPFHDQGTFSHTREEAIAAYYQRDGEKGGPYLYHMEVYSPLLKNALGAVFDGYPGIHTQLTTLTFSSPFREFYYRWHLFENFDPTSEMERNHINLLDHIVSGIVYSHINTMKEFTKNGVISFDYLWSVFPHGMDVYVSIDGQDRLFEVIKCEYVTISSRNSFRVECRYVACDGSKFGCASLSCFVSP